MPVSASAIGADSWNMCPRDVRNSRWWCGWDAACILGLVASMSRNSVNEPVVYGLAAASDSSDVQIWEDLDRLLTLDQRSRAINSVNCSF